MFGYAGKILYVDLTHRKTRIERISNDFCKKYLGGNGFASSLLYRLNKPEIDPLSPENAVIFAVGPFTATIIPSSHKFIVQAKSPLTNLVGMSLCSGSWGPALKMTGYDTVVILGKSEKPIYLFIDDGSVQFADAKNLWGRDAWQTEDLIREETRDEMVRVAAIGPAGENLVRMACITNDKHRQAGRTGMGAVMGSKNLKAIAARGMKNVEVAKLDELMEVCGKLIKDAGQGATTVRHRTYGTPHCIGIINEKCAFPTRNWQEATSESTKSLYPDVLLRDYPSKHNACWGCPVGCDAITTINDGPFKGTVASVEHESIYSLGPNCDVFHYPSIAKAVELCDRLGVDTISVGSTIAWAMECYERGILTKDDTDGVELNFGDYEAQHSIIRKIAAREGFGDILADGVKRASEKVGKGSARFALHNKGLEFAGYDVRGLKASALAFCTSIRGGCHLRAVAMSLDFDGKVDRFKADSAYGKMVMNLEDIHTVYDSLIVCLYIQSTFEKFGGFGLVSDLYELVTGARITPNELYAVGERVWNLEKAFNLREGWEKKDDYPPPRVMLDPIPSGIAKGARVTKKEFDLMLNAYFEARGWTIDGVPTRGKLVSLGLDDVAEDLEQSEKSQREQKMEGKK